MKGYYESNTDVNPPLKLEPCILAQGEQVYLAEPLVCTVYIIIVETPEMITIIVLKVWAMCSNASEK